MNGVSASILLFSDGCEDAVDTIRQLHLQSQNDVSLATFLERCATSLRNEFAASFSPASSKVPAFSTIIELTDWFAALDEPELWLGHVLLCVAQIGCLLREASRNSQLLSSGTDRPLCCVGLCMGMFAAAVAAVSGSTSDILELGPNVVALYLRFMFALVDRSKAVDTSRGSWTTIALGMRAHQHGKLIKDFIEQQRTLLPARYPYISAEADTAVTISGPPPVLKEYFSSCDTLSTMEKIITPVHVACHAPHLRVAHLQPILGPSTTWENYSVREGVRLYSMDTGEMTTAETLSDLLSLMIDEILNRQLRWGDVLSNLSKDLAKVVSTVTIRPIGPVRVAGAVQKKLSNAGLSASILSNAASPQERRSLSTDDIAIVGFSGRLPGGADDLSRIWLSLKNGVDSHSEIPGDRFDLADHYDASGKQLNATSVPYGCFITEPGKFDTRLFRMSPREANQTDPMQRLALLTTHEALEMAGYSPNATPSFTQSRIGTFFGQTVDDYRETNACQDVDMYYVSGGVRAFGPGRISFYYKWSGPSLSVDTACSSSAIAIQLAFQSLRNGECDLAVAGGCNIITGSDMYAGLAKGGFLSKTGQCKTFDQGADGYCRGEGVGSVVLKRVQDAISDRDNIVAVIKAASTNHSAYAASITRPEPGAQINLMRRVLRDARLKPEDIDYVEMHGTGTQAGDCAEFSSVAEVFRDPVARSCRIKAIRIGSVKANHGHGEAAAGVNSLIKILLMLRHDTIPPHIGIVSAVNPQFDTADLERLVINRDAEPFVPENGRPRRVVLNSFNATGGNTAMIIEDGPSRIISNSELDPRSTHVVTTSACTQKSFQENRLNLLEHIRNHPELRICDLAYTTTARRMHYDLRASYVVQDLKQLEETLENEINTKKDPTRATTLHDTILVFTGQGSHYLDSARGLFETNAKFRERLHLYDSLCVSQGLPSFLSIINGDPQDKSTQAQFQLSIVAIQMALARFVRSLGIKPAAVIGHSIGEFAAMQTAGVLTEADALFLVGSRGRLIDRHCTEGEFSMLSCQTDLKSVEQELRTVRLDQCVVACHNTLTSHVVSGPAGELTTLSQRLAKANIQSRAVDVKYAFHSPQMYAIREEFADVCRAVKFCKPQIPFASTLRGRVLTMATDFDDDYLVSQTLRPVKFHNAVEALSAKFDDLASVEWLELGTHPTCGSMIASITNAPRSQIMCLLHKQKSPWQTISECLAKLHNRGSSILWPELHKEYHRALSLVDTPRYSFDLANYFIPYKHSWRLKKGSEGKPTPLVASAPRTIDPKLAPFHYLDFEERTEDEFRVRLACSLKEDSLTSMIRGHLVEGRALCPSSVYAHLALNAATYVLERVSASVVDHGPLDLSTMDIISPLVLPSQDCEGDLVVTASWISDEQVTHITFATGSQEEEIVHCRCSVTVSDAATLKERWSDTDYLISARVDDLQKGNSRPVSVLHPDLMYQIFAKAIVNYGPAYQICRQIRIDYDLLECVAELRIPDTTVNSNGSPGTYCLDALAHSAGFVLNSDPKVASDTVFIAGSWSSLALAESLMPGKTYLAHSRMVEAATKGTFVGNVSILDAGRVVGLCRGLKFHRLKRRSLHKLLGAEVMSPATQNKPSVEQAVHVPRSVRRTPPEPLATPAQQRKVGAEKKLHPANNNTNEERVQQDITKMLEMISSEVGIPVTDLTDGTTLGDLGIDSLLSVSLIEKFKAVIGDQLPINTFSTVGTVGKLKALLKAKLASTTAEPSGPAPIENTTTIPQVSKPYRPRRDSQQDQQDTNTVTPTRSAPREARNSKVFLDIVSQEAGIAMNEISPGSSIQDLGIDSLLIITVIQEYKTATGEDLSTKFFSEYSTVGAIVKALDVAELGPTQALSREAGGGRHDHHDATSNVSYGHGQVATKTNFKAPFGKSATNRGRDSVRSGAAISDADSSAADLSESTVDSPSGLRSRSEDSLASLDTASTDASSQDEEALPGCVSMRLQGDPNSDEPSLFFLPDGSGSLFSYAHLPDLKDGMAVYAFDSPFHKNPDEFNLTFAQVAEVYYQAIKRIQPKGPYRIAGWSLGGVFAYEVSRRFLADDERVEHLIMIDSPCPGTLPPLPNASLDLLEKAGVFQGLGSVVKKVALHTRTHFVKVTSAFNRWDYRKITDKERELLGDVTMIWAQHGVLEDDEEARTAWVPGMDKIDADMMKAKEWLTGKRHDFSDGGWAKLTGKHVKCLKAPGNHFSIMFPPVASEVGALLSSTLAKE